MRSGGIGGRGRGIRRGGGGDVVLWCIEWCWEEGL